MKQYILIVFIFSFSIASKLSYSQKTEIERGLSIISKESLMQTVGYLSSDKFKGRLQGTHEYDQAARYVSLRFKEIGLLPVNQGSMLNYFNDETNSIIDAEIDILDSKDLIEKQLKLGSDFVCRGFSGSGNLTADVVFCGFGVSSGEYDDYRDIDVKGKIVMVYKACPSWKALNGNWGETSPRGKARLAKLHGAKAILFINQPSDIAERALIGSVACGEKPHLNDFPMIQIGNNVVNDLHSNSNETIKNAYNKIAADHAPHSFDLNKRMRIFVEAKYFENKPTANVLAKIDGVDENLKNEFLVIGAHLDHVGIQRDIVFPGANDNASGVASIIEIANAIQNSGIKTKRSILFVVFSSEESGLRGSKYFVENSPVSIKNIVAMLNFDCVGQGDSIAIGGKLSYPNLWGIAKMKDSEYTKLLSRNTFGGGGADAEEFHKAGIPTLYFNTSNGYKYLHLPSDKTETLNSDLFKKLTELGFITIMEIANGNYKGEEDILKNKN